MVVVQLFAAEPNGDRRNVAALVFHFVVAVTERVADTVHDARGPEGDPQHLHAPDDGTNEEAEEINVEGEHDENADPVQATQQVPLDPVVRRSLSVFLEHTRLP